MEDGALQRDAAVYRRPRKPDRATQARARVADRYDVGYDAPLCMSRIVIFSGGGHPDLARAICRRLKVPLSPSTTTTFSNDCLGVQLEANCRQAEVFIVQPLAPPVQHHLMELLLMLDAARGASAARITAVIPHFAYARSDKKDAPRISIAARLVADLLVAAGADRVLAMTLHSPQVHGFFSVPVDHLNALKVLARHFLLRRLKNTVVVSPDLGNAKEASHLARRLGLPMAAGSKKRLSDDRVVIDTIVGDVDGKDVIVLDDEIANGGTIVEILNKLRERRVNRIAVACTHGLFTGKAIARLGSQPDIAEIVTTDTVPIPPEKRLPNMKILSIAPLLAEAIRRIHIGKSVSMLFDA
jgi:ribose-phosphate pyrophosphokinase